jgi:outer membrane receptor for ferrienterochelin and colicins
MKQIHLFLLFSVFCGFQLNAQSYFRCIVKDSLTGEMLTGVTALVEQTTLGAASGVNGNLEIRNIPPGNHTIRFSSVGYATRMISLACPIVPPDTVFLIFLSPAENELEEVNISATRTNSRIEDLPTRIEVIGLEDLNEENGIKPSGISSMLSDIAGVQLQQTSATTGNTEIRIQGLDGKYTQMLYDGMPLFGGFSGSLGVLQIPPLDLKQIEIIKGASSTLHGGGAIAGLINLVSKSPQMGRPEGSITVNGTSLLETDVNAFFSARNQKAGYSLFGGGIFQQYMDINNDGFTDLPLFYNIYLHPSLFLYLHNKGMVKISIHSNYINQKGGDVQVMKQESDLAHRFYVANQSIRNTLSIAYTPQPGAPGLTALGSLSQFYRNIETDLFNMNANQYSLYSELNYLKIFHKDKLVTGINLNGEFFNLIRGDSIHFGNTHEMTPGFFIQNEWTVNSFFTLETGFRADYNTRYGWFLLPRINALFNVAKGLKTRLGGGMGYGTPTNFMNSFQEQEYPKIKSPSSDISAEGSIGANWDINFDKVFSPGFNMTFNQSFFYTSISNPIIYETSPAGYFVFSNAARPVTTIGFETYLRMKFFNKFEVYLGYVYTDARKKYDPVNTTMSLNARNKISTVITYEPGPRWMLGLESSYIGRQYTDDYVRHPDYFFIAMMVSYRFKNWRFVLNGENLLDFRQSRTEAIVLPPYRNPEFPQLWAPIDGRVINLSVTFSLNHK